MKYIKLFEDYKDTDFEITDNPTTFSKSSNSDTGKSTSGKFIGNLTPEHQVLVDKLKSMFIEGSFKGITSGDFGAIVGSGAGKRDVDSITIKFAFYQPTIILYIFVSKQRYNVGEKYRVSVEHPNNQSDNMSKDFSNVEEMLDFLSKLGRLDKK